MSIIGKNVCFTTSPTAARENNVIRLNDDGSVTVATILPRAEDLLLKGMRSVQIDHGVRVQLELDSRVKPCNKESGDQQCRNPKCTFRHTKKPTLRPWGMDLRRVTASDDKLQKFGFVPDAALPGYGITFDPKTLAVVRHGLDLFKIDLVTTDTLPADMHDVAKTLAQQVFAHTAAFGGHAQTLAADVWRQLNAGASLPKERLEAFEGWQLSSKVHPTEDVFETAAQRDYDLKRFFVEFCMDLFNREATAMVPASRGLLGTVLQIPMATPPTGQDYFTKRYTLGDTPPDTCFGQHREPPAGKMSRWYGFTHPLRDYESYHNVLQLAACALDKQLTCADAAVALPNIQCDVVRAHAAREHAFVGANTKLLLEQRRNVKAHLHGIAKKTLVKALVAKIDGLRTQLWRV